MSDQTTPRKKTYRVEEFTMATICGPKKIKGYRASPHFWTRKTDNTWVLTHEATGMYMPGSESKTRAKTITLALVLERMRVPWKRLKSGKQMTRQQKYLYLVAARGRKVADKWKDYGWIV
jgi:hypothetical protein